MKYFINSKSLNGSQIKRFLGITVGKTKPMLDLISIAIVAENDREFYAISKEFNLKGAWSRFNLKPDINEGGMKKVYYFRETVLKSLWCDLFKMHGRYPNKVDAELAWEEMSDQVKYVYLKLLILKYGKTNKEIASEIELFVFPLAGKSTQSIIKNENGCFLPAFYSYYPDCFLQLYRENPNLPKGFPEYCISLKQ